MVPGQNGDNKMARAKTVTHNLGVHVNTEKTAKDS